MSIFKRISASFVASIDQVVGDIENTEAVVKASLDEQRRKLSAAKLQRNRILAEERALQHRLNEAVAEVSRWEERAVSVAPSDEQKALQCLERREQSKRNVESLGAALADYQSNLARFNQNLEQSEATLDELRRKHSLLKARQASVPVQDACAISGQGSAQELEGAFDRWELSIAEKELIVEDADAPDALERDFSDQEKQAKLRAELASLMNKGSSDE